MTKDELEQHWPKLFASGSVWWDGNELVGIASDGKEVLLGEVSDCDRICRYLWKHPTPQQW